MRYAGKTIIVVLLVVAMGGGCGYDYTGDVPDNAYCAPVDDWPSDMHDWEARIFELVNHARSLGANCTPEEHYGPTHEYRPMPELVCSARAHSMDMHDQNYFSHTNLDGESPSDRAGHAGYDDGWVGENIVGGYGSAEEQFEAWMSSPGHCRAIMNPDHRYIGVGTYLGTSGYGQYSTANFAR